MKRLFLLATTALLLSFGAFGSLAAYADTAQNDICTGALGSSSGSGCAAPTGSPTVNGTLENVINILTTIIGAVAIIMIIVGGMQIVFSGGDPGKVKNGREAIIYALIGIVIVLVAQVLVKFVLAKV